MQILQCMNKNSRAVLAVFAIFFLVRTTLMPLSNDDYSYAFIWDGEHGGNLAGMQFGSFDIERRERVESLGDIFQSMWSHYFTWGGRIFAHSLVQFFVWIGKPFFDVANTIIFVGLVLVIMTLAGARKNFSRAAMLWIFFCVFMLSKLSVVTMFWLTGACNYLWMSFFQLLFLVPYVRALRNNELFPSSYVLVPLLAGCSNEAGALVTICLTIFLIGMCKARGLLRPQMIIGLVMLIVGCAFMLLAPGNIVRLNLTHPDFQFTAEIFFEHLTNSFVTIVGVDLFALIPMFIYFFRRSGGRLNTAEILMLAFAATGLLVPTGMLFSPEFHLQISLTSMVFVLVAATSAILEQKNYSLFPIPYSLKKILAIVFAAYAATLIYVDVSIFREANRQAKYIQQHADLYPVPMPPMHLRHRFEKIHGDRSAVQYLEFFAGVEPKNDSCRNSLVAQYYGAKYVFAVEE
ncbi:MAG: hypothetical protein IJS69_06625 [Selenomonadaceae bacterium]|nr:hypothetical protein [Selenomonadaceae bacterium]